MGKKNKDKSGKQPETVDLTETGLNEIINSLVYGSSTQTKKLVATAERNSSYEASYNAIRNWCDAQNKWTADSCLILANIVFGWMPTTILFYAKAACISSNTQEDSNEPIIENMAAQIAEMVNTNEFISDQTGASIEVLKHFLTNSYVGASKFLHFIYPHHFAMWDNNVIDAIGEVVPYVKGSGKKKLDVGDINHFLLYQKAMRHFVRENAEKSLREVELLLFKAGQKESGEKQ